MDVVDFIAYTNSGRDPRLLRSKFEAMASGPFEFLRASAAVAHATLNLGSLPPSPVGWVTGDLHVENFGTFKGANRLVYFDLNDFDESARLPLGVDIVRLLVSVLAAAREHGLHEKARNEATVVTSSRMAAALACGKPFWLERDTARGAVRELIEKVAARRRRDLVRKATQRVDGQRKLRRDGRRLLDLADPVVFERIEAALEIDSRKPSGEAVHVLDVATRAAGKGSLGRPRYTVLARREEDSKTILLDLKAAAPSSAAEAFQLPQPSFADEATRIVAIQQRCQAVPPARLAAVHVGRDPFVLRSLQPQEDRIDMRTLADCPDRLVKLFGAMGELAAFAFLRAAGRDGAAGPDELMGFGRQLEGRTSGWHEAAVEGEEANRRAHATFREAWLASDPRLEALCARDET